MPIGGIKKITKTKEEEMWDNWKKAKKEIKLYEKEW
jgi:hypothetical protein